VTESMQADRNQGFAPEATEATGEAATLRVEQRVAHLMLNRPDAANGFTMQMVEDLYNHVGSVAADPDIAVLVLSGSGRRFCVGGDLPGIDEAPDRSAYIHDVVTVAHGLARRLYALDKPVVAAVHGAVAGAGVSLTLLSDIVVAERATKFATAYTSVGLTPDLGLSFLLPRAVGMGRALNLTIGGPSFSADDAHQWGLVTYVVDDHPLHEAQAIARRLAEGPYQALGSARRLLRKSMADGFDAHLDAEAASIVSAVGRPEASRLINDAVRRAK
jgi:2-(1,2-epoxy-1,2-dihydrophenyl)acetyl-CoA isomerase